MNCPMCPGKGELLGSLGNMRHYRCRDCGWIFSNLTKRRKPKQP